jgi:hypothetical protein
VFEYHGWATLRDSLDAFSSGTADDLSESAYDAVAKELADVRNGLQTADLRIVNGSAHLWIAGLRNHRQDSVIAAFRRIAQAAPLSYGLLHVYDDEARGDDENRWVAWVMKRGTVVREPDQHLSPHVDVVEDDLNELDRQLGLPTEALIAEFADVERVEYVPASGPPYGSWVWLATATDAQRDALAADPKLEERVRQVCAQHAVAVRGVTVESQETVERDFQGSWFYRLR